MSYADLPPREQTAAHIAGALVILGRDPADAFAYFWNQSDEPTKAHLCRIGKVPAHLSGEKWESLQASYRGQIKKRANDLREWLNRVLP